MVCLSGFELYSRWVPLIFSYSVLKTQPKARKQSYINTVGLKE